MGGSSSRETDAETAETRSLESRLASLGLLPDLRALFAHLSPSFGPIIPHALEECFELQVPSSRCPPSSDLSILSKNVSSTLITVIFEPHDNAISWKAFLKGFEKCNQPSASMKLKLLMFFYYQLRKRAKLPLTVSFTHDDSTFSSEADLSGSTMLPHLQDLLWLCWLMEGDANTDESQDSFLELPDTEPLLKSAQLACSHGKDEPAPEALPIEKLHKWVLHTVPALGFSLFSYIQARLHRHASKTKGQNKASSDAKGQDNSGSSSVATQCHLLSPGLAWVIGLSQPDSLGYDILSRSLSLHEHIAHVLYRSSVHGKGMNRFWVQMEGYQGPTLIIIQAITIQGTENNAADSLEEGKWVVGALLRQGFENKNYYYGRRGCCIFAFDPVMQPFRSTGVGSNFVYSHSHVASSTSYLQQQKGPEGIAFGGDIGKERLFLDEDFTHVTIRHHAVDKTYEAGHLVPNQGYATVKGRVLNVEVCGFGGEDSKEKQAKFLERQNLFVEQKRKVDLQSFGNWADSPEKKMMDMVSDPNRVRREER